MRKRLGTWIFGQILLVDLRDSDNNFEEEICYLLLAKTRQKPSGIDFEGFYYSLVLRPKEVGKTVHERIGLLRHMKRLDDGFPPTPLPLQVKLTQSTSLLFS
jgi:hypothetical protein